MAKISADAISWSMKPSPRPNAAVAVVAGAAAVDTAEEAVADAAAVVAADVAATAVVEEAGAAVTGAEAAIAVIVATAGNRTAADHDAAGYMAPNFVAA
jgi:hypothetical protein